MSDLPPLTLEQQLARASQEIRNLQVMAMRPDQPREKVKLVRDLERLLREETGLLRKAIDQQSKLKSPPDVAD